MSCPHCEAIRASHRAILDQHDLGELPRWGANGLVDAALMALPYQRLTPVEVGGCGCECHEPARFIGLLPRIAA